MPLQIMEERPLWVAILEHLDKNGARRGRGYQVDKDTFSKAMGCNGTTFSTYIKQMEIHGIVRVDRTTVDGSFGSPRAYNRYHLLCTVDRWVNVLGPAIIAERRDKILTQRRIINRNSMREINRNNKIKRMQQLADEIGVKAPTPLAKAPVKQPGPLEPNVLDEAEIEYLADGIDDDSELVGW